jgi:hypothetical protein
MLDSPTRLTSWVLRGRAFLFHQVFITCLQARAPRNSPLRVRFRVAATLDSCPCCGAWWALLTNFLFFFLLRPVAVRVFAGGPLICQGSPGPDKTRRSGTLMQTSSPRRLDSARLILRFSMARALFYFDVGVYFRFERLRFLILHVGRTRSASVQGYATVRVWLPSQPPRQAARGGSGSRP